MIGKCITCSVKQVNRPVPVSQTVVPTIPSLWHSVDKQPPSQVYYSLGTTPQHVETLLSSVSDCPSDGMPKI